MKHPQRSFSGSHNKEAMLSNIALLYYGEGLTQSEIAKRLKLSRVTIVNMLRECRESGVVEIRVDGQSLASSNLSRELCEKYALDDVYVAITEADNDQSNRDILLPQVGRVAAMATLDIVAPGDRIGVAWGETIATMAGVIPRAHVANTEVCQLIGSKKSDRVPASEICAIEVANKLGARCHTLHTPGIVSSVELAEAFRTEPTIEAQIARLAELDFTIASIGNMANDTHLVAAGLATTDELKAAKAQGTVGVICSRFIDAEGQEVFLPPQDRIIAASVENIRAANKKMLVVCGSDRLEATRAAIKGQLVTHLVVDQHLAQALIDAE